MADQDDVRRTALSLPGITEDRRPVRVLGFEPGQAEGLCLGLARESRSQEGPGPEPRCRGDPGRRRVGKETLIAADPEKFFTEPHYNGFPAMLVRLAAIPNDELEELLDRRLANPGPDVTPSRPTTQPLADQERQLSSESG